MSQKAIRKMDHKDNSLLTDFSDDMSEQITDLKVTLESKRFALKKKIVGQNRLKMEKTIVSFLTGRKSVVEGENSHHIFGLPNEIWEVVFDNFDESTDIQSCFNTCHQFRSSCSTTQRTLIQLKKILPILFKTGYLTHNQILNLRVTSKPINKCVDQFYQSKKISWHKSSPPIEYDLIPYCYNCSPLEILMQDTLLNVSKGRAIIRYQVLSHPQTRNPFLSRYVMIHDNTGLTLDRFRRWDTQVIEFLELWGKQIWYLTLRMNCTKSRFLEILKLMPNLKHLKITGSIKDDSQEYSNSYNKLLEEACPNLTSLVFPGTTKFILGVHNNLISSFSGKVQEFQVETWKSLYSEFYWPSLRKLVVSKVDWLVDLCNCRADNLFELSVYLCGYENFDMFFKMVNNFPKLEVLEIKFGENFGISDNDVIKTLMEDNYIDKVVCKVKRLSLKMPVGDKISFSILALFPMLEYLEIEKEFGRGDKPLRTDWWQEYLNGVDKQKSMKNRERKVDLVEIEKFLNKNQEGNLNKSNVWKLLPFLREIKVNNLSYDTVKVFSKPFLT